MFDFIRELVTTESTNIPDITRYCRVTYRDCFLRPGREFYPTARKLREKIFLSRYYLLREFEGLTIKRDEYSDIPEARESALRFKQFMKCCTSGKINLIKALEVLRQLADKKEKLPKSALEACKRLEGALLFTEPPVIPIPIAVFHPDILQNSIIGLQLCNPILIGTLLNFPPGRREIVPGYTAGQLYNRMLLWPEGHSKMIKTAYQLSGGSPIFKGSPHTFPNETVLLTAQKRKGQYKPQTEAKRHKLV